jgi:bifunctional non-homologous end joining protein LigD
MSGAGPVEIAGRTLRLSNLDKVLWPEAGITKGDLVAYYRAVAPALLPHLTGRALTLARFPEGIHGPGWYQSNCRGNPDWVRIAEIPSRAGSTLRYCVVDDEASLVWVANLGTIELHPFLAPVVRPRHPHAVVFDLDPGLPATMLDAARVALLLRDRLAALRLDGYPKTSGRMGLHVYVPTGGSHPYDETAAFARRIAEEMARSHPDLVVDRMSRAAREGRVYIDWGQNHQMKSTIAPYSLRAWPMPQASTPLRWEELEETEHGDPAPLGARSPSQVLRRLERHGDLFAPVVQRVQELPVFD